VLALAAIAVVQQLYEDDVIGPIAAFCIGNRLQSAQLGMLNGVIRFPNVRARR